MEIYRTDNHHFILSVDAAEYDEALGGLYFLDKEGKSNIIADKMTKEMQDVLDNPHYYSAANIVLTLAPPAATSMPKLGLTETQKDQVQKMIEAYALKVEKRREKIIREYRAKFDRDYTKCSGDNFTAADLTDDDNTKY